MASSGQRLYDGGRPRVASSGRGNPSHDHTTDKHRRSHAADRRSVRHRPGRSTIQVDVIGGSGTIQYVFLSLVVITEPDPGFQVRGGVHCGFVLSFSAHPFTPRPRHQTEIVNGAHPGPVAYSLYTRALSEHRCFPKKRL